MTTLQKSKPNPLIITLAILICVFTVFPHIGDFVIASYDFIDGEMVPTYEFNKYFFESFADNPFSFSARLLSTFVFVFFAVYLFALHNKAKNRVLIPVILFALAFVGLLGFFSYFHFMIKNEISFSSNAFLELLFFYILPLSLYLFAAFSFLIFGKKKKLFPILSASLLLGYFFIRLIFPSEGYLHIIVWHIRDRFYLFALTTFCEWALFITISITLLLISITDSLLNSVKPRAPRPVAQPAPSGVDAVDDLSAKLSKLELMRSQGAITDEEYNALRTQLLNSVKF